MADTNPDLSSLQVRTVPSVDPDTAGKRTAVHELTTPRSTTYPSNCLHFLQKLRVAESESRSKISLKIIIVGAGLGGLSTAIALATQGHKVTVYEQAPQLGEVY
jgi:NADPH-dependent 2,4-dienoyl-CoA reductase/sulfur reductase-like enzyme